MSMPTASGDGTTSQQRASPSVGQQQGVAVSRTALQHYLVSGGQVQGLKLAPTTGAVRPQLLSMVVVPPGLRGVAPQVGQPTVVVTTPTSVVLQHQSPHAQLLSGQSGTVHHHGQTSLVTTTAHMTAQQRTSVSGLTTSTTSSKSLILQPQTVQVVSSMKRPSVSSTGSVSMATSLLSSQLKSSSSPASGGQPRKKIKLEPVPALSMSLTDQRKMVAELRLREMNTLRCKYREHLAELFFLQNGGNIMDYFSWRKRPNPLLADFLKSGRLDADEDDDRYQLDADVKIQQTSGGYIPVSTPVAISTTLPPAVTAMQASAFGVAPTSTTLTTAPSSLLKVNTQLASTKPGSITPSTVMTSMTRSASAACILTRGPVSPPRLGTRQHAISAVYDSTLGSQEAIVERAKQEAQVMQRVAVLRKGGLWSARRLPKVQEPPRHKAHWDYLLEEMQWLAADFAQERKWKKAGARKIARMVYRYHQELHHKEIKAEKEEGLKLKRIAGNMAKMIKEFWNNIERVVQFKQTSRLEEKRKKALDIHLSFIVDQTEKYSTWLTEGLNTGAAGSTSSKPSSIASSSLSGHDGDFDPESGSSDDEETITKEEEEASESKASHKEELDDLKKESEMPLEDLLKSLPKEVLEKTAPVLPVCPAGKGKTADGDFEMDGDESEDADLEETLDEQENHEEDVNHKQEIDELKAECDMSIDELRKKYAGAYDSDFSMPSDENDDDSGLDSDGDEGTPDGTDDESTAASVTTDDEEDSPEEEEMEEGEEQGVLGTKFLLDDKDENALADGGDAAVATTTPQQQVAKPKAGEEGPAEITDIAAQAMSLQPTGYTLETTQVKVQAPFLLKHTLREYQLIGLNWMVTMHDRKLNGILADEMGLGKTIQTIALLAHLVVSMGVWGPHLIVVPTSVMLNWEMELKKWCPAFKILTYYGTQKERKQKRQGWTKTNAFHVCITSYKLVIQDHQAFRKKKKVPTATLR